MANKINQPKQQKTSPQLDRFKYEVAQEIGIADKISSDNQKKAQKGMQMSKQKLK